MKITIVSPAYPLRGGIAHFTGQLYKELIQDHDVNVITFSRQYPSFLFPGKTQLEGKDKVQEIPTRVELDSINPLNWIKVGKQIKADTPDLVIFSFWLPFFGPSFGKIAREVKKHRNTKTLAICHNVIPHESKPGDKPFTKYFFKAVDYFVLLSEQVKEDLHSVKQDAKYKVLFHPVYSSFGDPVDKNEAKNFLKIPDEKTILFFGIIRDYKGLDTLLKAVGKLKEKIKVNAIIAGEFYTDDRKYLDLINELDIKDSVYLFNNFIPSSEVKYFFSAADLVVLPYKSATQSGIVQIANNFYKPVVATKVGGLTEIVKEGETGYLVDKEAPEQLAEAIVKFYENDNEQAFSENVKRELDKYSWEKFVEGIMKLVDRG